jgi:hypothetical protein
MQLKIVSVTVISIHDMFRLYATIVMCVFVMLTVQCTAFLSFRIKIAIGI